MDPHPNSCSNCFKLIEEVEEELFVKRNISGALEKFREFFVSIGWTDPEEAAPDAAHDKRSDYYRTLVDCEISDTLLITPVRRLELEKFAKSIREPPTITCSIYIENTLVFILNNSRGEDLYTCIKFISYVPIKESFLDFMAYVRSPGSAVMSGPRAMNAFRSFMSLVTTLIMKKINISVLVEERELSLISIPFFLSRMYGMIQKLLKKINSEEGSVGINIILVSDWFAKCNDLRNIYIQNIKGEIQRCRDKYTELQTRSRSLTRTLTYMQEHAFDTSSIQQIEIQIKNIEDTEIPEIRKEYDKLTAIFIELRDKTKPFIDKIKDLNHSMSAISQPGTPLRQGGAEYNRVKNNSKSKKYKKNNSKSKKYKKNNSKSKKYKKNNSKSKKYKKLLF
jgi:hypothetical protein